MNTKPPIRTAGSISRLERLDERFIAFLFIALLARSIAFVIGVALRDSVDEPQIAELLAPRISTIVDAVDTGVMLYYPFAQVAFLQIMPLSLLILAGYSFSPERKRASAIAFAASATITVLGAIVWLLGGGDSWSSWN